MYVHINDKKWSVSVCGDNPVALLLVIGLASEDDLGHAKRQVLFVLPDNLCLTISHVTLSHKSNSLINLF